MITVDEVDQDYAEHLQKLAEVNMYQANELQNVETRQQILAKSAFLLFLAEQVPAQIFVTGFPIYYAQNFELAKTNKDDEPRHDWLEVCALAYWILSLVFYWILQSKQTRPSFTICYVSIILNWLVLAAYFWAPMGTVGLLPSCLVAISLFFNVYMENSLVRLIFSIDEKLRWTYCGSYATKLVLANLFQIT